MAFVSSGNRKILSQIISWRPSVDLKQTFLPTHTRLHPHIILQKEPEAAVERFA